MSDFRIDAKFDSTRLVLRMRNGSKRLAYAAVNAINKTAKHIQRRQREHVEKEFTIRKPEFMKRQAAIIKPFASVKEARAYAVVAVGEKPRLLLSAFERGAERKPATPGARVVAEPVIGGPARPTFRDPVPTEFRMKRLRFDKTKSGKARKAVAEASLFLIPGTGIFQRLQGQSAKAVYIFTRGKRLRRRLQWEERARGIADRWLPEYFQREVAKAIAHDKGRSF